MQLLRVGDDLPPVWQPLEVEIATDMRVKRRHGGGSDQQRRPVAFHQFAQGVESRREKFRREKLGFIEHDDAAGNAVQLAAPARSARKEGLEELY